MQLLLRSFSPPQLMANTPVLVAKVGAVRWTVALVSMRLGAENMDCLMGRAHVRPAAAAANIVLVQVTALIMQPIQGVTHAVVLGYASLQWMIAWHSIRCQSLQLLP